LTTAFQADLWTKKKTKTYDRYLKKAQMGMSFLVTAKLSFVKHIFYFLRWGCFRIILHFVSTSENLGGKKTTQQAPFAWFIFPCMF